MVDPGFVRKILLFHNLEQDHAEIISDLLKEVSFQPREKIVEEGKAGESMYIIVSGRVKVYRTFGEEIFTLTELGPYDFFGEMSLIDDFAASATVESVVDTTVLRMTRSDFKAVASTNSDLSSRLWESLARSLTGKIRKTGDLVKMYYGLNKALCENEEFRKLYTSWNFHVPE